MKGRIVLAVLVVFLAVAAAWWSASDKVPVADKNAITFPETKVGTPETDIDTPREGRMGKRGRKKDAPQEPSREYVPLDEGMYETDEIPSYPGIVQELTSREGSNGSHQMYSSPDEGQGIMEFYRGQLERDGWEMLEDSESASFSYLAAQKGGQRIMLTIRQAEDKDSIVNLSVLTGEGGGRKKNRERDSETGKPLDTYKPQEAPGGRGRGRGGNRN